MYLSKKDIQETAKVKRLNIINSVSGIKPGNLIGTISDDGVPNLAIVSSVVHLGSDPALLGYILRPSDEVRRDTYMNIQENGCFTINHIPTSLTEKAHYTSAKFDADVSEFDACGLTEAYFHDFKAPFVQESGLKMGLRHVESIPIKTNGTMIIVGEIEHLIIPDVAIDERGYIDLGLAESVGISGLNSYYTLQKVAEYPYARVNEVPDFKTVEG